MALLSKMTYNRTEVKVFCDTVCVYYINNKTHVGLQIEKRKANMTLNFHSHRHLMGPALMAGGAI